MKQLFQNNSPFSRSGHSDLSLRMYLGTISIFVSYGLLLTFIMANYLAPVMPGLGFKIVVGLILPIIGCFIASSDNMPISLLGYHLILVPIGLCLGPIANFISPDIVQHAAILTALITAVMGICGVVFPNFFKSIGGFLFYSLLGLLVVRLLQMFIPSMATLTIVDYIAAFIFSLYIGYDMYRATTTSRTVINALHISVSLYLDIINLFINLVKIFSSNRD